MSGCEQNVCTCPHGTRTTGQDCNVNGNPGCDGCNHGYKGDNCDSCDVGFTPSPNGGPDTEDGSCIAAEHCTRDDCTNHGDPGLEFQDDSGNCNCSCDEGYIGNNCRMCDTAADYFPSRRLNGSPITVDGFPSECVSPCVPSPCLNGGRCSVQAGGATGGEAQCDCTNADGYTGEYCEVPVDYNDITNWVSQELPDWADPNSQDFINSVPSDVLTPPGNVQNNYNRALTMNFSREDSFVELPKCSNSYYNSIIPGCGFKAVIKKTPEGPCELLNMDDLTIQGVERAAIIHGNVRTGTLQPLLNNPPGGEQQAVWCYPPEKPTNIDGGMCPTN